MNATISFPALMTAYAVALLAYFLYLFKLKKERKGKEERGHSPGTTLRGLSELRGCGQVCVAIFHAQGQTAK